MLLVLFAQPPTKAWVGGDLLSGDRRASRLVIVLLVLFLAIAPIPLAQRVLNVGPMRQLSNYVVIGLLVCGWALVLPFLWRSRFSSRLFWANIGAAPYRNRAWQRGAG